MWVRAQISLWMELLVCVLEAGEGQSPPYEALTCENTQTDVHQSEMRLIGILGTPVHMDYE